MVSTLGLLLVHLIDKSLDFVRFVTAEIHAEANAAEARPLLAVAPLILSTRSKQLCLKQWWQFGYFEVLAVLGGALCVTFAASTSVSRHGVLPPASAFPLPVEERVVHPDAVKATAGVCAWSSLGRRLP